MKHRRKGQFTPSSASEAVTPKETAPTRHGPAIPPDKGDGPEVEPVISTDAPTDGRLAKAMYELFWSDLKLVVSSDVYEALEEKAQARRMKIEDYVAELLAAHVGLPAK